VRDEEAEPLPSDDGLTRRDSCATIRPWPTLRDDTPVANLEKLKALLALAAPPGEDVAFLADLMSLPTCPFRPFPSSIAIPHSVENN
jgi:hypothetical protein